MAHCTAPERAQLARNDSDCLKAPQRENLGLKTSAVRPSVRPDSALGARVFARLAFINDVSSRPGRFGHVGKREGTASVVRHDG